MAILQVLKGLHPGQLFPIEGDRAVLGRHPDCDVVLDVGAVSRQHAEILRIDGEYYVQDLKSRNGTFVNGQMIEGQHRLEENDRLKVCDLLFTFHHHMPGSAETPTGDSDLAMFVDDDESANATSTIMSKLDLSSSRSGIRFTVKPEAKLRALIEISDQIGAKLRLDDVLPGVLDALFKIFLQADRGFIVLRTDDDAPLETKAIKHRRDDDEQIRISRTIVNQAMDSKEAILSADAASDSRFDMSQSIADFRIRSMMCAPLVSSEGVALGVIHIDTVDQRSRFQQDDLDVLAHVARQAALAVENAQLHEQALQQERIQRDLALAREVQYSILPNRTPELSGYSFFQFYESAQQVGGDYYDYIELPDGRLGIVVADVSGKGISAALLMAKLAGEMRFCLALEPDPAAAVSRLNASILEGGSDDRFVTLALAVINPKTHELAVVNAGHLPPLLRRRDGTVEGFAVEEAGVPLGIDADLGYEQAVTILHPGETVSLYTDGISEAMNEAGDLYGLERINKQIAAVGADANILGKKILEDVKRFVGSQSQSDDICISCFGRIE